MLYLIPVVLTASAWAFAWILRDVHGVLTELPWWFRTIYRAIVFVTFLACTALAWVLWVVVFVDLIRWLEVL